MSLAPVYARSNVRAGTMRHLIAVQSATETRTAMGSVTRLWTTDAIRSGHVMPLSGGEFERARAIVATATHKVTLRHYEGLTPKMRLFQIESDGQTGDIQTSTNATPIVAHCNSGSGIVLEGEYIWIRDVAGNTATNGVWRAGTVTPIVGTRVSAQLLDEDGGNSTGNGAYTSGGTWEHLYGKRILNILHIADLDSRRHTVEVLCGEEVL